MSSSISIPPSEIGLNSSSSNSEKLNKEFKYEDYYNGLETEIRRIRAARIDRTDSRSYIIRRNNLMSRNSSVYFSSNNETGNRKSGFYQEVDDRMSRNSMEYPQQQAEYAHVNRWLDDQQTLNTINLTATPDLGNVIGIKGFSKALSNLNCGHEEELRRQKANYNKLKFNHIKLESDYERLRSKFQELIEQSKKLFRQKDSNIDVLKKALKEKHKRLKFQRETKLSESKLIDELRGELSVAKLQLMEKEEKLNAMKSDKTSESLVKEVELLRNQLKLSSSDANKFKISSLKIQNKNLINQTEQDHIEYQMLKENYNALRKQVNVLIDDHKKLEEEKNEEISRLLVELCRYQVQQPKLEMILKNEREVRLEMECKMNEMNEERQNLLSNIDQCKKELSIERAHQNRSQLNELEKVTKELTLWQDRFERLKKEKSDSDDLVRSLKLKVTSLDNRRVLKEEQLADLHKKELEKLQIKVLQMSEREQRSLVKIEELNIKLKESETLRQKLLLDVQNLTEKMESTNLDENNNMQSKKGQENQTTVLREIINKLEFDNRELKQELKSIKIVNERHKQQLHDVQQRFKSQQKAFEDLKEKRDEEVTKLRKDLNFEKYNRQVSLKGMERQLRVGLRELENVKYRFVQSGPFEHQAKSPANLRSDTSGCSTSKTLTMRTEDNLPL